MRSLRQEITTVVTVLAVPAAAILSFPVEALCFRALSVPPTCKASAAFVRLTPEQEAEALVAAKSSWRSDASARELRRLRLPLGVLPESPRGPLIEVVAGLRPVGIPDPVPYRPQPWKPSLRAAPPDRLSADADTRSSPAFSRDDLLKLN